MITPACGLVGLDVAQAAHVLDLTNQLAQRVADRAAELALDPRGLSSGPRRRRNRAPRPSHLLD